MTAVMRPPLWRNEDFVTAQPSHPAEAGEADVDHEAQPLERELLRHVGREVQRARAGRRRRQLFQGLQQHGSACQSQPTRAAPRGAAPHSQCPARCALRTAWWLMLMTKFGAVPPTAGSRGQPVAKANTCAPPTPPLTLRSAPLIRQKVRRQNVRTMPRSSSVSLAMAPQKASMEGSSGWQPLSCVAARHLHGHTKPVKPLAHASRERTQAGSGASRRFQRGVVSRWLMHGLGSRPSVHGPGSLTLRRRPRRCRRCRRGAPQAPPA